MEKCININHFSVKELADELNLPKQVIAAKIALWQEENNTEDFPKGSDLIKKNQVNFITKVVDSISNNINKIISWSKNLSDNLLYNKIQKDLQIPKDQLNLFKESKGNTIEEKLASFIANYSYSVEINTAKESKGNLNEGIWRDGKKFEYAGDTYEVKNIGYTPKYFKNNKEISFDEIVEAEEKLLQQTKGTQNTQYYSNLTVPGGTNYTENEIATPLITSSIKGHAAFSTNNGIGWFRSDDKHPFTGFLEDLIASGTIKKVPCG